jgi:signal transduction histidine kinase
LYRTFSAQEEERKRISRELHDETCQLLTGLGYALDNAEADAPPETRMALEQMHTLTDTALDGVHRIISDLRPSMLDHLGFIAALRWYAETRFEGIGIQFSIREIGDTQRLPAPIETALFRVAQEAINNIAQHSHAAHASFVFQFAVDCVEARIADDGDGFVPGQATTGEAPLGMGLMGMEERMSAIGGTFRLRTSPGAGTVIRLHVPYRGDQL